ncbi:MAG: phosphate ABC transporter substrate-binding protein [Clostridiales bacterium]|uniref:Phosphate-binding protein n=1 Tax=Congzhengia minquanensis TaxID=2763657 RepID=A0A926DKG9_9FIRM|nr:phosphate ABC transporter substrate-binding protein [Congzhengia minquanensis]MBC8539397.1 phosphate ABC transporter substrate-binding protein [Congzhengia minquanensis]MBD8946416.1 phosphate ABC transporter substrate-binding protein [Clostridiales bacterium]
MKTKKFLAVLISGILMAALLSGCGTNKGGDNSAANTAGTNSEAKLSGTIKMAGSTSMEKLANALSESFMAENPKVSVTAEFIGSSAGIEAVTSGSSNIGNSSRALKDSEKSAGIAENIVAIDGIAVIVNKGSAEELTKDQLVSIYKGETKNWSDVGASGGAIVVVGREAGSGTRDAFEEILELKNECAYANELDSTGAVMAKVASTPGAIGYVSLDVLDDSVTALKIDGVEPTEQNIKDDKYLLSRPFIMATKGEISQQNELVKAWFDYIESDAGQKIIQKVGLITVK